jgi:hypothetical protein
MPVYHANFHTQSYRSSRPSNNIIFGAADDAAAAAVATELGNWTTGRLTSLTKGVSEFDYPGGYPSGTRITASAVAGDNTFGVGRIRWRNVYTATTEEMIAALLTGAAFAGAPGGGDIVALSAPPELVGGGVIEVVSGVTFTDKR